MAKADSERAKQTGPAETPLRSVDEKHVCELLDEIHTLEQLRREQITLRELSRHLKSSITTAEALSVLRDFGPRLWRGAGGAVYLRHPIAGHLDCAVTWGEGATGNQGIDWQDCRALRNLRPHRHPDGASEVACPHVLQLGAVPPSICVPLVARGQMLGLLHLHRLGNDADTLRNQALLDAAMATAEVVAEDLSLAHANELLRDSLREQSIRDALTGLFNRRFVDEFLVRELARAERKTRQLSIISLDIDHFKRINDSFGHGAGDLVLQEVGSILQAHVRDTDIASRVGGEEFLLLLSESPLTHAVKRAEDIRSAIHGMSLKYENADLGRITASFGAVAFPDHGRTPDALIRAADRALYAAKNTGRNKVVSAKLPLQ